MTDNPPIIHEVGTRVAFNQDYTDRARKGTKGVIEYVRRECDHYRHRVRLDNGHFVEVYGHRLDAITSVPTPKELADEYRRLRSEGLVIYEQLFKQGYCLRHPDIDYDTIFGWVDASKFTFEKEVTTKEVL